MSKSTSEHGVPVKTVYTRAMEILSAFHTKWPKEDELSLCWILGKFVPAEIFRHGMTVKMIGKGHPDFAKDHEPYLLAKIQFCGLPAYVDNNAPDDDMRLCHIPELAPVNKDRLKEAHE